MTVPVIFVVPVWGEKYVKRWLEYSLPSLLTEGNLPAARPAGFLIVTRPDDCALMAEAPAIKALGRICQVETVLDATLDAAQDMTRAHEAGMKRAKELADDPAICFLNADMIVSDGTYRTVREKLEQGYRGVMTQGIPTPANRPEERGHLPQWKAPFPRHPSQLFWPDERGLLMHSWHLYPLAMRVGEIGDLTGTIDNDLAERCATFEQLAFIQDSKDGGFVSLEDNPGETWGERIGEPSIERVVRWANACSDMHRKFFALPFRFGSVSKAVESEAAELVDSILSYAKRKASSKPSIPPMRALFITTQTNEVDGHVAAWDSFNEIPSTRVSFDPQAIRHDYKFIDAANAYEPNIIFYIGAHKAPGNPRPETFHALRKIAPLINLVSDAADQPWHPVIAGYRIRECFDLQVSIDGALEAPTDMATVTPVDIRHFENGEWPEKDIRFGFTGSVGRWNNRSEIVKALEWFGDLKVRRREVSEGNGYADHVRYMKRCRILLNVSFTGSQQAHHIKGRVIEAGWARCALLEHEGSPIHKWFPKDCYLTYRDPREAADIARSLTDEQIDRMASRLGEEIRMRFTPQHIYGEILQKLGLVPAIAA
jgi:hypothetical protein